MDKQQQDQQEKDHVLFLTFRCLETLVQTVIREELPRTHGRLSLILIVQ